MRLIFVQPAVGRKTDGSAYPKTWIMEPLWAATVAALLPKDCERTLMDDRLGEVDCAADADAVLISVECYTAKRSYEIADRFRARGVKVLLGGFHATLYPEEAQEHADALMMWSCENYWAEFWSDLVGGTLRPRYRSDGPPVFGPMPDRSIFGKRDYGPLCLVETARGCRLRCDFCSICKFFRRSYTPRPVEDVVAEMRTLKSKYFFFVDDNLAMDIGRLKALCRAVAPLRRRWVAQLGLNVADDEETLELLARSGCEGVLIGFESLSPDTLRKMGKDVNRIRADYARAVANLRRHHISVYATFVFGYDDDTSETFRAVYEFALKNKFFFAAFNHLVPFPGTDVYDRLKAEGRLLSEKWWLDPAYTFGDVVFRPKRMSPGELAGLCQEHRLRFYSVRSILRRFFDFGCNTHGFTKALVFLASNFGQEREVVRRRGLPWGGDPQK